MRCKVTVPLVVVLLLCSVAVVGSPLLGTAPAGAAVVAGPMEDLGGLTTAATGRASDLNESGAIVGESNNRAFRYDPTTGEMIDISPLPASAYSRATGINEAGTIVGITDPFPDTIDFPAGLTAGSFVHDPASGDSIPLALSSASAVNDSGLVSGMQLGTRRAVWHALGTGVTTNIPLPLGSTPVGEGTYQFSSAADINATGVVAGSAYYPLPCVPPSPCLLSNGYRYTTTPPAATSGRISGSIWGEEVTAINDDGDVTSAVVTFPPPAFTPLGPFGRITDQSGLAIDVPTLGGSYTIPHDISDGGLVVGESETATGQVHAFVFDSNTSQMLDLGTLGGANSKAFAINDSGLVVGEAANASGVTRPFRIQTGEAATIRIGDSSVAEGNGTTNGAAISGFRLSAPLATTHCVWYHTANVSATGAANATIHDASHDYVTRSNKFVKIAAGKVIGNIASTVLYDSTSEGDETFRVVIDKVTNTSGTTCLTTANTNVTIADGSSTITILNDDPAPGTPTLTIGDSSVAEGNGTTNGLPISGFRLSAPLATTHCVWYHTENVSATGAANATIHDASHDYVTRSNKFVKIAAGKVIGKITSTVLYDSTSESDETFHVVVDKVTGTSGTTCLTTPDPGITIVDGVSTVTIVNDDL